MSLGLSLLIVVAAMLAGFAGAARADTAVTVPLADAGQGMWVGNASNARLGLGMQAAGDMNGDGVTDLVSDQRGSGSASTSRGVWVLFTQPNAGSARDLSDLPANEGYRMRVTNSSLTITSYFPIGDQNGDGVTDFLIRRSTNIYVVYGVADPAADLPKCDPASTSETRCLDIPALVNLNGDRMGYQITSPVINDIAPLSAVGGDFDGDGQDELAIGAGYNSAVDDTRGAVLIVRHGLGDLCPAMPDPCSLDFSLLGADDLVRIDGPAAGSSFGYETSLAGDLNGDGKDDLLTFAIASGSMPTSVYAIYGKDWQSSPVGTETFGPADGFTLAGAVGTIQQFPASAGDANGDGRPDIAVVGAGPLFPNGPQLSLAYTPEETPASSLPLTPPTPGQGYFIDSSPDNPVGTELSSTGDLNSDGFGDLAVSNSAATALSVAGAGATTIVYGAGPEPPEGTLALGSEFNADQGFSLVGDAETQEVGGGMASLGDIDDDGIPDFAVASTATAGKIFLVRGRSLFGSGLTGLAGGIRESSATVGGTARANGRQSDSYFEYGKTAAYGSSTQAEPIGQNNQNKSVEADLSGLDADTTYHYRLVVENDLGLKAYGQDRTFKTAATVVDPCDQDNTQPGCPGFNGEKFCQANPNDEVCQRGSDPEKFCEANPAASICKPGTAGLSDLIANSNAAKVRRGKTTMVWAWITSTGTKSADGVKVCASAPKSKAKIVGKSCRTIASLAPGKTAKVKFKFKAKARKGAKVKVKLTASAQGVSKKTAKVRLTIR